MDEKPHNVPEKMKDKINYACSKYLIENNLESKQFNFSEIMGIVSREYHSNYHTNEFKDGLNELNVTEKKGLYLIVLDEKVI